MAQRRILFLSVSVEMCSYLRMSGSHLCGGSSTPLGKSDIWGFFIPADDGTETLNTKDNEDFHQYLLQPVPKYYYNPQSDNMQRPFTPLHKFDVREKFMLWYEALQSFFE